MAVYPLSTSIRSNVPADSLLYDLCIYRMDTDRNKYYLIDVRQQKFKDNHQTQIHMSEDINEPLSTIYIMEMTLYRKTMLHTHSVTPKPFTKMYTLAEFREGANKQVISSQADSLIKISRIWADFFPANTSNQPI
ncbi:hypothetical protein ACIEGX_11710 [Citrobacter freundii]